jgi:Subtilase family
MAPPEGTRPQIFYLNETHELANVDKSGGGRIPEYVGISWASKSKRLSGSIEKVMQEVQASHDPLRDERYFIVAKPVSSLKKKSSDERKAPEGTLEHQTSFGGPHGRVFDRLGLDLIQVTPSGDAVVHGNADRVEQLLGRSRSLPSLGAREQSRWVTIDAFEQIPLELRVDGDWLENIKGTQPADAVFELQPILGRVDADRVLRAITDLLRREGERLTATGTDFSGRYWFRGKATQRSIRAVARDFFSVQSIHSPLYSSVMASRRTPTRSSRSSPPTVNIPSDANSLPCVAVVDLGVPADHIALGPYRRGQFIPQNAVSQTSYDHASFVASRIVFGNCASADELAKSVGRCSFYDAVVGDGYLNLINDKIVMDAIRGVRGAAPDVRVFNLSFGDARPLSAFPEVEQREKRLQLQDLDNFAFANDVLIVVAAGNSKNGVIPQNPYPNHMTDEQWALGPWSCGFNTLVCGSFVGALSANGLVKNTGWPSPFTRIGPGLCDSPVPSFSAEGGNCDSAYNTPAGLGVWGLSGEGLTEDRAGTSHSAPILAREAALTLAALRDHCAAGTQPFSVTARAYLALTAIKPPGDAAIEPLARRTLGRGKGDSSQLRAPRNGSAIILWQGVIETSREVARVQLPIPRIWLMSASDPILRIFVCYDPPVNEAARAVWACRKVEITLHADPDSRAIRAPGREHPTYPLFSREYKLAPHAPGRPKAAPTDLWVIEILYDEIFDYPAGMDFDPRQRVAFAAQLLDVGAKAVDPQQTLQGLPAALSMNRLSMQATEVRSPLIVRTRR